ncbi:type II toxin-antitoxin system VapC family toxin [Nonomuraea sp. B10E15]|uniref:type II toxin-antitoxin system VapC family toxin n=1 Tax=Nonomuraea sp. B10E15 TaxID=3153560 RepID=UPI00325EB032
MIVLDASVVIDALTRDDDKGRAARKLMMNDPHWAAPHHMVTEVVSGIRGLLLGGKISQERAEKALSALGDAELDLVDVRPHLPRMWQLRANLTAYDAAFVAVAEAAECVLVTGDRRLAVAAGVRCPVHVI